MVSTQHKLGFQDQSQHLGIQISKPLRPARNPLSTSEPRELLSIPQQIFRLRFLIQPQLDNGFQVLTPSLETILIRPLRRRDKRSNSSISQLIQFTRDTTRTVSQLTLLRPIQWSQLESGLTGHLSQMIQIREKLKPEKKLSGTDLVSTPFTRDTTETKLSMPSQIHTHI